MRVDWAEGPHQFTDGGEPSRHGGVCLHQQWEPRHLEEFKVIEKGSGSDGCGAGSAWYQEVRDCKREVCSGNG